MQNLALIFEQVCIPYYAAEIYNFVKVYGIIMYGKLFRDNFLIGIQAALI